MGKQFLAQKLNAPITKNHGLSNRLAQPVVTVSLNERNAVINNTKTTVRSTINKPHHIKIMIIKIFEKDDFFSQWHRLLRKKKIRELPIKVEPMTFWLQVQTLFHSKLQETGGS